MGNYQHDKIERFYPLLRCILASEKTLHIVHGLINSLEEKKAEDVVLLDLKDIAIFTDYFIICSGTSNRMLNSLVRSVRETAKKKFNIIGKKEGEPQDGWITLDYGDVVVHIFSPKNRAYYQLEKLWEKGRLLLKLK